MATKNLTPLFSNVAVAQSILGIFDDHENPTKILAELLQMPIMDSILHAPNNRSTGGKLSIRKTDMDKFNLANNQKFKVILIPIQSKEGTNDGRENL